VSEDASNYAGGRTGGGEKGEKKEKLGFLHIQGYCRSGDGHIGFREDIVRGEGRKTIMFSVYANIAVGKKILNGEIGKSSKRDPQPSLGIEKMKV